MFKGLFFLLLVFLGQHFQRMINNPYPIKFTSAILNLCQSVLYCSLAYTGASRSFMFTEWVTVEINLCATYHIFTLPSFAGKNLIASHKHFSFFIAFSVSLAFQN